MRRRVQLCVITDATLVPGRDHVAVAEAALAGGADMIQLRDKTPDLRTLLPQARCIRAACRARGALFIVNDRLDLALAAGADGVHLGQDDLPAPLVRQLLGSHLILGVSTHDPAQAGAAVAAGADYIGFGPMFGTRTKDTGYAPRGTAMLRQVRETVPVPIVAIGGITLENVGEVIAAGADAPAVISAVAGASDVAAAARGFRERVLAAKRQAGLPA